MKLSVLCISPKRLSKALNKATEILYMKRQQINNIKSSNPH